MTGKRRGRKSVFTDEQWEAIVDARLGGTSYREIWETLPKGSITSPASLRQTFHEPTCRAYQVLKRRASQ